MSPWLALPLLMLSLAITLSAASMFARRLDRLGVAFGLPEALVGLLTALAADGPEISSALVALAKGDRAVSVGVVVGSNAFNLAAMVGLSALLAGAVRLRRAALALEGAMGGAATLLAAAVLLGWLPAVVGVVLLACVGIPYLTLLLDGSRIAGRLAALPGGAGAALAAALTEREDPRPPGEPRETSAHRARWIVSDTALILLGSFGMVQAAVALGDRWGASGTIVGVLILAPLTSVPNALTGVRLGLGRRGSALVSETLNSNTINLVAGVMIPALLVTVTASSTLDRLNLAWLVGMTAVAVGCLARPRGARRGAGALLLLLYTSFVTLQLTVA
jgi:cation:H+ antiporter